MFIVFLKSALYVYANIEKSRKLFAKYRRCLFSVYRVREDLFLNLSNTRPYF